MTITTTSANTTGSLSAHRIGPQTEVGDQLGELVTSPTVAQRATAAASDDLTLEMIEKLAIDDAPLVRCAIASNPLVAHSREAMRYLANDRTGSVVQALAANPVVPRAYLETGFAGHPARYTGPRR